MKVKYWAYLACVNSVLITVNVRGIVVGTEPVWLSVLALVCSFVSMALCINYIESH